MEPLFPELPGLEDLKNLSDDDLGKLLADHEAAVNLINNEDDPASEEFLAGRSGAEIIVELEKGVEQIKQIRAEIKERADAHAAYLTKKAELTGELAEPEVKAEGEEDEPEDEGEEEGEGEEEAPAEEPVAERELVTASVDTVSNTQAVVKTRFSRTPPAPSQDRIAVTEETPVGTPLVAAGEMGLQFREPLTPQTLADLVLAAAKHHGPHPKVDQPGRYRFGGPEHKIAQAEYPFPEERTLGSDAVTNLEKLQEVIVEGSPSGIGRYSLAASGGLCAPLEPFYTMPNFASEAEPVWDSLPIFRARRGGVNVPTPTTISDIETAISSISEANDALGGTFATKTCQDLECPEYTEVAVNIIAHCREYGNLNARAWPEKIAHENALTMAAMSRTSETFILDRIKALSINLTQAEILGTYGDLVHALTKARAAIRNILRMDYGVRFNVVIPEWIGEHLAADVAYTQFDRYQAQAAMINHLESLGFRAVLYKDPVTGGTSQAFSAASAGALADFPDDVQYAIYPDGQFLGIDSGTLELGIVRDSTLNATNDFQVFGERFRNLAMLGPAQGAYWITQGICPSGEFPALGTALSC